MSSKNRGSEKSSPQLQEEARSSEEDNPEQGMNRILEILNIMMIGQMPFQIDLKNSVEKTEQTSQKVMQICEGLQKRVNTLEESTAAQAGEIRQLQITDQRPSLRTPFKDPPGDDSERFSEDFLGSEYKKFQHAWMEERF